MSTPEARLGPFRAGDTTTFRVWSASAERVDLCLLDGASGEAGVPMARDAEVWSAAVVGLAPGQQYGFRAYGPDDPGRGHRFDPSRLLVDPYARSIDGGPMDFRSVLVDEAFDWGDDQPPATEWSATVIYEAHVRGLTKLHPDVPPALRGTYAGLGSEPVIAHLRTLGVTAVELLPIHQFASEAHLIQKDLTNYWGYSTIGFFAPHGAYAASLEASERLREVKWMVRALHRAGIEVILDVVYNHTAEGGPDGPTHMFRGLGDAEYYRHAADDPSRYDDVTGCGNTVDTSRSLGSQLVLDSLRYWIQEFHIDGFRFDLATTLGREGDGGFSSDSALLQAMQDDPIISAVKLIAEPWDVGLGGYQVGGFPRGWAEWNGPYRDDIRDAWRGAGGGVSRLGTRLAGSSDRFNHSGRQPWASINFLTAHDGFTLADLTAYEQKHNLANLEDGRDGTDDNRSQNFGVEGPTADPAIQALRWRQQRNLLATLLISQGVPMLVAGDEFGRTQGGNNNAYCQDNEISWVDWHLDPGQQEHLAFVHRLIALRHSVPAFRRETFFAREKPASPEIHWFREDGRAMTTGDWDDSGRTLLAAYIAGAPPAIAIVNLGPDPALVLLPPRRFGAHWMRILTTADPQSPRRVFAAREEITAPERSVSVLTAS